MLDIQKFIGTPKIIVSEEENNITKFELNYLPRWFWHTLWNALRRIILSYNVWWSVTWLKIKWVPHEYHVIDWVKEDVIAIMLNFKNLRFKFDESVENLQWIPQRFKGVGKYDSSSLKLPSGVELLNDWEYLFEITDPSLELNIDLRIEKWYKYYSVKFLRNRDAEDENVDVNTLVIDNEFKLVDYIKYDVNEVIDDFTWGTKDSLKMEIRSLFGGVSAKEIVMFAGEVLASYAKLFIFDDVYIDRSVLMEYEELNFEKEKLPEESNIKTMPIDALPLSERTRNALIKNQILYVEDLEKKKKWELLLMKWVGRKAIDEINQSLWNIWKTLIG
jgi:DNA-directed RNA polymerase subunit alpha